MSDGLLPQVLVEALADIVEWPDVERYVHKPTPTHKQVWIWSILARTHRVNGPGVPDFACETLTDNVATATSSE
jgi:hypothetical protein